MNKESNASFVHHRKHRLIRIFFFLAAILIPGRMERWRMMNLKQIETEPVMNKQIDFIKTKTNWTTFHLLNLYFWKVNYYLKFNLF